MNYFAIDYPNHTTLVVKSGYGIKEVLFQISQSRGLNYHGTIYNPESYLSLRPITNPDDRQKLRALTFQEILIGG